MTFTFFFRRPKNFPTIKQSLPDDGHTAKAGRRGKLANTNCYHYKAGR